MADIEGDDGPNRLRGTNNDDDIRGRGGDDVLKGRGGDDELRGDEGDDKMNGGAGNDRLRGDHGNDTLTGGAGNDRFIFNRDGDTDTVRDFTDGEDKLDMSNFGFESFEEVMSHAEQVGDHVVFSDLDVDGETVILRNVDIETLDQSDFILFG
jgi:Ca2+-binding RTX toxin-like protein